MLLCSNELFLAYIEARPGLIPILVTEDRQRAEGHHRRHQYGREAERIKFARVVHACDALIVAGRDRTRRRRCHRRQRPRHR